MRKLLSSLFLPATLYLVGCGAFRLNPVTDEERSVRIISDQSKTLTFRDYMVWYDQVSLTRGLRLPKGVYQLEAEDDVYRYFKAPEAIEYRVLQGGKATDGRMIPGGIALARQPLRMVPAGVYMNKDERTKVITWKLGKGFLRQENNGWMKSFN